MNMVPVLAVIALAVVIALVRNTYKTDPLLSLDFTRPLELSDFEPSDGLAECEMLIRRDSGYVSDDYIISFPIGHQLSIEAERAVEYLVGEWDYGMETL